MSVLDPLRKREKEAPFLIFLSFLISFAIARLYEFFEVMGPSLKWGGGTYTGHHLYYGVACLIMAGWIAINYSERSKEIDYFTAILYGIGLGLFFDEIGLILTHFENYWDWITYTFVIAISAILLNVIYFQDFWDSVRSNIRSYAEEKEMKKGPLNLMGVINILDGVNRKMPETKTITGVFTGLVLIGAGVLILEYPELIKYWVAGAFFLSGVAYIVRNLRRS